MAVSSSVPLRERVFYSRNNSSWARSFSTSVQRPRQYKKWNKDDRMDRACQEVHDGKPVRRVADEYDIPCSPFMIIIVEKSYQELRVGQGGT